MIKSVLTAVILGVSLLIGSGYAADSQTGLDSYQTGDNATDLSQLRPLAEQGDARAQFILGGMYRKGEGVTQNDKEAVKWTRLSAEQGLAAAQYFLGWMYLNGKGVIQDDKEAIKWYRLSAEQGYTAAQNFLALMYAKGRGVAQDYVYAHMWLNIAASNGFSNAEKSRDLIAELMTPEDISKAQALAKECVNKNFKGVLI